MSVNKNPLEKYSFPDYDPDQQLIAISKVINQLISCLDEKEKDFENTDYLKINSEYAGDLYAGDLCELGFLDVAVSHSAIAVFAPFLEGLFKHEITALEENGRVGASNHIRTGKGKFWDLEYFYDSNGIEQKKGKAKGIFQILDALNILKYFPEKTEEILEIIFSYRNYALHNGFEFELEKRNEFKDKIQRKNWGSYFFWTTTDGNPHMISMKKEFLNECFTFCRLVKEGFDKEKGILDL